MQSTTVTTRTTAQHFHSEQVFKTFFFPSMWKQLHSELPNANLQYSHSRKMAQTALSGTSTYFTFTPVINSRKAAPWKESTFTRCVTVLWLSAYVVPGWGKKWVACQHKFTWKRVTSVSGVSTARKMAECRPAVNEQFVQDTLSFHRFQTCCWLECEVTFRFITLLPTRSHRQHCHKSRKVWRAENTQKCPQPPIDNNIQTMPGWSRTQFFKRLGLVLGDKITLRYK